MPQVVGRVIETLQSGSVVRVEVPWLCQGSGFRCRAVVNPFGCQAKALVPGWCRAQNNDERTDGYGFRVCTVCRCGIDLHRSFGEVVTWSHAAGAGALAACGDVLTAIADVRLAPVG